MNTNLGWGSIALMALPLSFGTACAGAGSADGVGSLNTGGAGGAADGGTTATAGTTTGGVGAEPAADAGQQDSGGAGTGDADAQAPLCPPSYAQPGSSRCVRSADRIECPHNDSTLSGRSVLWQTPLGPPPVGGWPLVVVFQGTGADPSLTWAGDTALPFGGFHQIELQAMLLDNGFSVVAPEALGAAWATNFPGYELSPDYQFIFDLLESITAGAFGPADTDRLYATGISSGGYMTSRMAVSYPGSFRALAIQSGSYATCTNVLCNIPEVLPLDHPPTLFLHGEQDIAVPIVTARAYADRLSAHGIQTRFVTDPSVGHAWLPVAPEEVTCWFLTH